MHTDTSLRLECLWVCAILLVRKLHWVTAAPYRSPKIRVFRFKLVGQMMRIFLECEAADGRVNSRSGMLTGEAFVEETSVGP